MRGVFNKRPSLPKYTVTWNPQTVLNFLKTWDPLTELSLKQLSLKLAVLALLLSGRRGQTLISINIHNITFNDDEVCISLGDLLKTSQRNRQEPQLIYKTFPDSSVCFVTTLREYLKRTETIRQDECQLLISYAKPHKRISRDTLSRWIREILQLSGIDLTKFKPHSMRSASTSYVASKNVSISTILAAIGWRTESTFTKFYQKSITNKSIINDTLLRDDN